MKYGFKLNARTQMLFSALSIFQLIIFNFPCLSFSELQKSLNLDVV